MILSQIPANTTGRKKIFANVNSITESNVKGVVETALLVHAQNVVDIEWLFQLYRGKDSVIDNRVREGANSEINHKAYVNYYSLIADYAANLFMQRPIVYVNADGEERVSDGLRQYGKIQRAINQYARDKTTAIHAAIAGVAYQFVELDKENIIKTSVLSPSSVFSIYGDDTDDEPMAMVYITQVNDSENTKIEGITGQTPIENVLLKKRYTVYTDNYIFEWIEGDDDIQQSPALSWGCPIIEYKMNPFYIGSFERVTSLIHLLSLLKSDSVNGVVQSIAGILLGKNIGIPMDGSDDDEETLKENEETRQLFRDQIKKFRQLYIEDTKENPASLQYITTELFNADIDILYQQTIKDIITITKIPNSVINIGGSGNKGAAETASGIPQALENAQNAEPYWFESKRIQTRKELAIMHYKGVLKELNIGDIDFAMQRTIAMDPVTSSQAYMNFTNAGVKPADAARLTYLTADPEEWEKRVLEWREQEDERRLDYERSEIRLQEGNGSDSESGTADKEADNETEN